MATVLGGRPVRNRSYAVTDTSIDNRLLPRRTDMFTMHEALARDRMREREDLSRHNRLVTELAAANRWHYLEQRARAAHRRHASRARQLARISAVAE
jgi:hypothetical protein